MTKVEFSAAWRLWIDERDRPVDPTEEMVTLDTSTGPARLPRRVTDAMAELFAAKSAHLAARRTK